MDNRVIQVLEKIVENKDSIEDVNLNGREYYFFFRGGFFSILHIEKRDPKFGPYSFYIYPRWSGTVKGLIEAFLSEEIQRETFVGYHWPEFPEAHRSLLSALYDILSTRYMNLDSVFEKVLGDDQIPF